MMPVRLEPAALRPRVKHSTTEPLCSLHCYDDTLFNAEAVFFSYVTWFMLVFAIDLSRCKGFQMSSLNAKLCLIW